MNLQLFSLFHRESHCSQYFHKVVNNFYATDNGEAGEEAHGSTNYRQLGFKICLLIFGDLIKSGSSKKDPNQAQFCFSFVTYLYKTLL